MRSKRFDTSWRPPKKERVRIGFWYRGSNAALMAVPVQSGQTFAAGSPTVVFEGEYAAPVIGGRTHDVSADGRCFLMMKEARPTTPHRGPRSSLSRTFSKN